MKKNFIRLNINDNYLSLGNFFRVLKDESNNSTTFWQADLFSIIFNVDSIADSTVNNYCTGFRAINATYKNYIKNLKIEYSKNPSVLLPIFAKILQLIDINSTSNITVDLINKNEKLFHVCNKLYSISKNDLDVSNSLSNILYKNLHENNLYNFIAEVLFYTVLEKKQPIYINENLNNIIEKKIYNTNISVNDIEDFVNIQLTSGIWSIRGIYELARRGNPFACFEMASMEYYGIIFGNARYEKAYDYYKIAAKSNHPTANWAIGFLYYEGHIGNKSKHDMYLALKYFNKARKLNCANAYTSIGNIFLSTGFPHINMNEEKAIEMFTIAANMGHVYAFNNLGKLYENKNNLKLSFEYYMKSANLGDSWAQNKVGEFYRLGKLENINFKKAFEYYTLSSQSPKFTLCNWSKYNLAKYFYKNGCLEIGIHSDLDKAISLFEESSCDIIESLEELICIYYSLYLQNNYSDLYLKKLNYYIALAENHKDYNSNIAYMINEKLKNIKKENPKIELPNI